MFYPEHPRIEMTKSTKRLLVQLSNTLLEKAEQLNDKESDDSDSDESKERVEESPQGGQF